MEFIWHYLKENLGAAIGAAAGIGLGGYAGIAAAGGLTLGGVALGLVGAAVAGGAAFLAGNYIDGKRKESRVIAPTDPAKPLASRAEPAPEPEREATYKVQMTPAMWKQIRDYTSHYSLRDYERAGIDAAEALSKTLTAEIKGKQVGDTLSVESVRLPPFIDGIDLSGKNITFRVKNNAIDFTHPDTVVGMDKLINAAYYKREGLFDEILGKLGPLKALVPDHVISGLKRDIKRGDIKNPFHNLMADEISTVVAREYLRDMARDYGTDGLQKVLKHRLMRFADAGNGFTEAKIDKVVEAITKEYRTNPAVLRMDDVQVFNHFRDRVPEIATLRSLRYPRAPFAGGTYSMENYVLDLISNVQQPIAGGLSARAGRAGLASLDMSPAPAAGPAPAAAAPAPAVNDPDAPTPTFARPSAATAPLTALAGAFNAGQFNTIPVGQGNSALPDRRSAATSPAK